MFMNFICNVYLDVHFYKTALNTEKPSATLDQ